MRHFLKNKRNWQIGGFLFGLLMLLSGAWVTGATWYYKQKALAATPVPIAVDTTPIEYKTLTIIGRPIWLSIPSLRIELEIAEGAYDEKTQKWSLSLDKAHFASISSLANNEKGDTYIYGHYRAEVFARLHTVKYGAQAYVKTDNGYTFTYTYRSMRETTPQDVSSLMPHEGSPTLSIQTCSGAWFQNRQIYTFDFTGVEFSSLSQ